MDTQDILKYKNFIAAIFIVAFSLFTLWVRLLPEPGLVTDAGVNLLGNDPWYILRQVEQTIAHFPEYAWFDAMTEFPTGNVIHWGPLFVQAASLLAIITGATTRPTVRAAHRAATTPRAGKQATGRPRRGSL